MGTFRVVVASVHVASCLLRIARAHLLAAAARDCSLAARICTGTALQPAALICTGTARREQPHRHRDAGFSLRLRVDCARPRSPAYATGLTRWFRSGVGLGGHRSGMRPFQRWQQRLYSHHRSFHWIALPAHWFGISIANAMRSPHSSLFPAI